MRQPKKPPFNVRRSKIQGRGAFASRRVRPGALIIEYTGQRIDAEEADERYDDDAMDRHHTFLFAVEDDLLIDGARGGNDARFFNHSCEPNCEAVQQGDRIFIEAIKNIQPGVELTYDYGLEREGPLPKDWKELYACRCGSAKCRGTVLKVKRKRKRRSK